MSKNIVFEGWLTKSPPSKRIWRTKWRRRWFALRQSGELPGQYFLDYYADRNCRRPKGTINLDLCEQVDAGLHMERNGTGSLDPKLRGSVFTIQTQSRTYHLEADCEAEMTKWVNAICGVCGLRPTDEPCNEMETYRISVNNHEYGDSTGPYIPISECITGVRAQERQRAFRFDTPNIVISAPCDRGSEVKSPPHVYTRLSNIRPNNPDLSENESNISDDDCKSLHASQLNIPDSSVRKSFTKLIIHSERNEISEEGPPVPPRPPKTFAKYRKPFNENQNQGPKFEEPIKIHDNISIQGETVTWNRMPQHPPFGGAIPAPAPNLYTPASIRTSDDDDEFTQGNMPMQYYNLPSLPPAVDRALKPRQSTHIVQVHNLVGQSRLQMYREEVKAAHSLQYLDLDLPTCGSEPSTSNDGSRNKIEVIHGRSLTSIEEESAYKTVDFLKTEAFNITRQDAEASRNNLP